MKISLCVTTYNRPDHLQKVFQHVRRLRRLPDELLVCDDGSGEATRSLIEREAANFPVPVHHLWQEDLGWRVTRSRNAGIRAAQYPYIVFIDGDCLPHPRFLSDHCALARPGHMVFGDRVHVKQLFTASFDYRFPGIFLDILTRRLSKRWLALRNPLERPRPVQFAETDALSLARIAVGCNLAFWREDAIQVNGFNEALTGWALEDIEFAARMLASGVTGLKVRRRATVFHLDHGDPCYDRVTILESTDLVFSNRAAWTEAGLSSWEKEATAHPNKPF